MNLAKKLGKLPIRQNAPAASPSKVPIAATLDQIQSGVQLYNFYFPPRAADARRKAQSIRNWSRSNLYNIFCLISRTSPAANIRASSWGLIIFGRWESSHFLNGAPSLDSEKQTWNSFLPAYRSTVGRKANWPQIKRRFTNLKQIKSNNLKMLKCLQKEKRIWVNFEEDRIIYNSEFHLPHKFTL